MTILQSVQEILSRAGLVAPNALDPTGTSNQGLAQRVLMEADLEIQAKGWHFNTQEDVTLTPRVMDNKIEVPTGAISIDTSGESAERDVTTRGEFLYDRDNNTSDFGSPLVVTYIVRCDFPCLPYEFAKWITLKAAADFNLRYTKDEDKGRRQQLIMIDLRDAEAAAKRFNGDQADVNVLRSVSATQARGDRTAYRHWSRGAR